MPNSNKNTVKILSYEEKPLHADNYLVEIRLKRLSSCGKVNYFSRTQISESRLSNPQSIILLSTFDLNPVSQICLLRSNLSNLKQRNDSTFLRLTGLSFWFRRKKNSISNNSSFITLNPKNGNHQSKLLHLSDRRNFSRCSDVFNFDSRFLKSIPQPKYCP